MSTVTFTASGSRFEISCKCLEGEQFQRLPLMVNEAKKDGKPLVFNIDRPAERFAAIVAYYQTGELHIPAGVCSGAFQTELLYWDIDPDKFADCCMVRYISFLDEQETARKFRQEVLRPHTGFFPADLYIPVKSGRIFGRCRNRLWNIIDNNESSVFAKVYFLFLFLLIMISIFSLALSTDEAFMRKLSKCEMIEYLEYTKHSDLEIIKEFLGNPTCDTMAALWDDYDWGELKELLEHYYDYNSDFDDATDTTRETKENETIITTEQTTTTGLPPATTPGGGGSKKPPPPPQPPVASSVSADASSSQIVTSTQKSLDKPDKGEDADRDSPPPPPPPHPKRIEIPELKTTDQAFDIIDIVLMVCFSLDLLLRLASCPSLPRYFLSVINLLDAVALVGTYIHVIVTAIKKDQKYVDNWLDVIEYLQIFRTLRLFRLVKNVRATKVLVYALRQSFKDLLILLMFLFIAVCTFASCVYFAEDRANFKSIPTGWWWALVTLTTVGYGDVYPKTWVGRAVGSACALTGVVLIALTLPIFVNTFLTLYQFAMVEEVLQSTLQRKGTRAKLEAVSETEAKTVGTEKSDVVLKKTNGNTLTIVSM